MTAPHLITPMDWALEALARAAADGADLREAAAARVESSRFRACAERIAELQARVRELTLYAAGVEAERGAAQAEAERLRADIDRYQPDGWRLGLPDGSHPPPEPLSDDGRTPAPAMIGVKLYRRG